MSNYYPVGTSMAARVNFDESVRNYAHDTWRVLDADGRRWAAKNWNEYFDIEQYDTDDEEELTARFRAVW